MYSIAPADWTKKLLKIYYINYKGLIILFSKNTSKIIFIVKFISNVFAILEIIGNSFLYKE